MSSQWIITQNLWLQLAWWWVPQTTLIASAHWSCPVRKAGKDVNVTEPSQQSTTKEAYNEQPTVTRVTRGPKINSMPGRWLWLLRMRSSIFCLCPPAENTAAGTKRLFDAILSGCIPAAWPSLHALKRGWANLVQCVSPGRRRNFYRLPSIIGDVVVSCSFHSSINKVSVAILGHIHAYPMVPTISHLNTMLGNKSHRSPLVQWSALSASLTKIGFIRNHPIVWQLYGQLEDIWSKLRSLSRWFFQEVVALSKSMSMTKDKKWPHKNVSLNVSTVSIIQFLGCHR